MTMTTLHVGTLDVVYRDGNTAARFEAVLRAMLEEGLTRALDEVALDPDERVYIRDLDVPVRLDAGASDAALVEAWSRAIAARVRDACEAPAPGVADDVVRWRSPRQARLELLCSVASGQIGRAWAWRRAGLLSGGLGAPSPDELLLVLIAEPRGIVALLAAVAAAGRLARLSRLLPRRAWPVLAAVALDAHDIPARIVTAALLAPAPDVARAAAHTAPALMRRSRLAQAASGGGLAVADAETAAALAALAVIEVEPSRLAAGDGATLVAAAARILGRGATTTYVASRGARNGRATTEPTTTPAATMETRAAGEPEGTEPELVALPATACGGLLYLFHLVAAEGLPQLLREEPRGLRWWLHGLGRVLADSSERDPAVLAFAGLAPDAEPPSSRVPAATEDEGERLRALAAGVVARLARAVEADPISLADLVSRPAEVRSDPGWIEVRFPLSAIDTRVRRAGLDRDPDFIPWLGCVVRFAYV